MVEAFSLLLRKWQEPLQREGRWSRSVWRTWRPAKGCKLYALTASVSCTRSSQSIHRLQREGLHLYYTRVLRSCAETKLRARHLHAYTSLICKANYYLLCGESETHMRTNKHICTHANTTYSGQEKKMSEKKVQGSKTEQNLWQRITKCHLIKLQRTLRVH